MRAFGVNPERAEALLDATLYENCAFNPIPTPTLSESVDISGIGLEVSVQRLCAAELQDARQQIARALLSDRVATVVADQSDIIRVAMRHISHRLWGAIGPTVAVEYNLNCLQGGEPSNEATMRSFLERCGAGSFRNRWYEAYPVLADTVRVTSKQLADAITELLIRVGDDRHAICEAFGLAQQSRLQGISFGAGDTHKAGRSVCFLDFADGRVVYKPRSLKPEVVYRSFTDWLREKQPGLATRSIQVLDRGEYGYAEFISSGLRSGASRSEAFYRQFGIMIATAWLLGIFDLHFENVIADGDAPLLVDLETILDKPLARAGRKADFATSFGQAFSDLLFHSLLLPMKTMTPAGLMDVSAIGSPGVPASLGTALILRQEGEDVGFVARTVAGEGQNRPHAHDGHRPFEFIDAILDGYDEAVSVILANKDELCRSRFLELLTDVPSRWIARATREYGDVLGRMRHPSVQRDAIERDFLVAALWSDADTRSIGRDILPRELRDLQQGDIPYFAASSSDRALYDAEGERIADAFACTGIEAFLDRLNALPQLIAAQKNAIVVALESTRAAAKGFKAMECVAVSGDERQLGVDAAIGIGDELLRVAHFVDGMPFWAGLKEIDGSHFGSGVLMPELYSGTLGLGCFFAALERVAPDPRWYSAVAGVYDLTAQLLSESPSGVDGGAFTGLGGVLYTHLVTAVTLDRPVTRIYASLDRSVGRWTRYQTNCDVISGLAGAMVALVRYHEATGCERAGKRVLLVRQQILERAQWRDDRCFWIDPILDRALTGFAHGSAGIAWALASSQRLCKSASVDRAIEGALRHCMDGYSEERSTWLDSRDATPSSIWCHGAAGIGLAADSVARTLNTPMADLIRQRAHLAVVHQGPLNDDCVCHGTLGNAEFLRQVGDIEAAAHFHAVALSKRAMSGSWSCNGLGRAPLTGLMCGISGIGYQHLRHANPSDVPNILYLEVPRR